MKASWWDPCASTMCANGACGGCSDDVYTAMTDCVEHSGDSVSFQTGEVVGGKCEGSTGG